MKKKTRQSCGIMGDPLFSYLNTGRTMAPHAFEENKYAEMVMENLRDFRQIVKLESSKGLDIVGINGSIIPLATYPFNTYNWSKGYSSIFQSIGKWMDQQGFRIISFVPEPIILNVADEHVLLNSLSILKYHAQLFETFKLDTTHKIAIRISPLIDNRKIDTDRFIHNFFRLPQKIRQHLVIMNDDKDYNLDQTIRLSNEIGVPVLYQFQRGFSGLFLQTELPKILMRVSTTWKEEDGGPVILMLEQGSLNQGLIDSSKMMKYNELVNFTRQLLETSVSLILDLCQKDIVAVKLRNILMEHKGLFDKQACIDEWYRYRYLLMAYSPDGYMEMVNYMENPSSFKDFYVKIELHLSHPSEIPDAVFAAEEIFEEMSAKLTLAQKKTLKASIMSRDFELFKIKAYQYIHEQNIEALKDNYYFFFR